MPENVVVTEQVQTAPVAPIEPAPEGTSSRDEVLTQIAEARVGGAPKEEINRLEALLEEPAAPVEAPPEPPAPLVEPPQPPEPPAGDTPPVPPEDEVKVSDRPRITHLSDEDKITQNAIILLTRKGLSLSEATRRIMGPLEGQTQPAAEPPAPAVPAVAPEVAALESQLADNEAKLDETDDSFVKAELIKQNGRINRALAKAETEAIINADRRTAAVAREDTELEAAALVYPDLRDDKSAFWIECEKQAIYWRAKRDPRAADVRAVADEAAKTLNRTPATAKAAAPPPQPPAPVAAPAAKPPGPAPGSRATAPPPVAKTAAVIAQEAEDRAMAAALGEKYVPGRSYLIPVETR